MGLSYGKQSLCITQLPDDPLCRIYQNLNKQHDQKSFSQTCHRFLDIAILSCKCLDVTSSTKLSKSYNLDSIVLGKYLNRFRHFESASLISVIDLYKCVITDDGLKMLTNYCKSIITVSLIGCSHITNTGIWFVTQNCHQLRALKISDCDRVANVKYQQGFSSTLAYLRVDSHVFYPTGFLSRRGLEYLDITASSKYYMNKCERRFAAIRSGIAKNLKILSVWTCSFVTDGCIMKFTKGCPLLQEMNLSCCRGIRLPGWESIGLHCQNLKIHVNYTKTICDKGLLALGNGCKSLSVLYIMNCQQITSDGLDTFRIQRADVKIEEKLGITCFPSWTFNWSR
ncbi:F-box/LRR-repeat protein 12-like [Rutidosis leptorrhynchoides]|uniref:F-box/LRR-repeat protein 12-like n=1 Tax=Rutidosis leptorrhynchoides TaxID=125765 RepID=UPI003A990B23